MPYLDLPAIKREITLKMVLDNIGWKPVWSSGEESRGPCPLHDSTAKRSRVFAVKGDGWFCHKCKDGGDQFRFWVKLHHVSFMQAVHAMCETFNVPEYQLRRYLWRQQPGNGEEER
jgi:hypothetical protein